MKQANRKSESQLKKTVGRHIGVRGEVPSGHRVVLAPPAHRNNVAGAVSIADRRKQQQQRKQPRRNPKDSTAGDPPLSPHA